MATQVPARIILLTGPPGVGKTTLIQKACSILTEKNVAVQGFYTEEVRSSGSRIGFDVVTLRGEKGPLARIEYSHNKAMDRSSYQPKVGQYSVKLNSFEQTALPTLCMPVSGNPPVIVIDEVGKMEVFSDAFVQMVHSLISSHIITVLATIPIAKGQPIALVEELRTKKNAKVFEISKANRDCILPEIISAVLISNKTYGHHG